jgi:acyl transferase domain-containing protein
LHDLAQEAINALKGSEREQDALRARAESAEAELRGHIGCVGHRRFASVVASLNRAREKADHFMRLAGRAEEERDRYEAALRDAADAVAFIAETDLHRAGRAFVRSLLLVEADRIRRALDGEA